MDHYSTKKDVVYPFLIEVPNFDFTTDQITFLNPIVDAYLSPLFNPNTTTEDPEKIEKAEGQSKPKINTRNMRFVATDDPNVSFALQMTSKGGSKS